MPESEKIDRVLAVVEGRTPDRPPVSFWYHFEPQQRHGPEAVRAHLQHLEAYDLDFLKVMNDNGYPSAGRIQSLADLDSLEVLAGSEPPFTRQLELLESLAQSLRGRVLLTTTLFNAWTTLKRLIQPKLRGAPPDLRADADEASAAIHRFIAQDRPAVARALATVGESLARFAARCIEAGADGVFLSVRDDWVDTPGAAALPAGRADARGTYDELVRPTDLLILEAAAAGRFNMLHVCGCAVDFQAFAQYPVQAINWADRAAGPPISEACRFVRPAICGGVDNLGVLAHGSPEDCAAQVHDALRQAGDRPVMIAPGCTFDPALVPRENLLAVCRAARGG